MADIMETAARKVFERYDIDGDGLVTAAEYRKVVAELEGSEITESQAQERSTLSTPMAIASCPSRSSGQP